MPRPEVSIVIPNWNGLGLLRPCLASLQQQTFCDYEIIVVDNASTDGSLQMVASEFPEVRVLALGRNLGFAGGSNAGIRQAVGDIVVALNNDTEAEPTWLQNLVRALGRHPEAGSAASRLMVFSKPGIIHSAGDLYGRDGIPNSRGVWQQYGAPYDREVFVFGPCGGAAAYRREMLDEIGLYDEAFFMYCEDVDLNWRAQLAGWKCVYVPEAVVHHHLSATGGGALSSYFVGRNTLWVLARNVPWQLLRKHWRAILKAQWRITRDALRAWRGSAARARLRGQVVGLVTCLRWLGYRHRLLGKMRVSADYSDSLLVPQETP